MKLRIARVVLLIVFGIMTLSVTGCGDKNDVPVDTPTYSVSFMVEPSVIIQINSGEKISREEIPDAEKENYEFLGWYNGEQLFDFNSPITNDMILIPKYENLILLDEYNGAKIDLLADVTNEYLSKSTEAEIAEYLYQYRESILNGGEYATGPKAVKLSWNSKVQGSVGYTVTVASDSEFNDVEYTVSTTETEVEVYNLIPRVHYYKVICSNGAESDTDSFENTDAIRTILCGNVGNMRDEGGYTGEFGKIEYGLVYRSKDPSVADSDAKKVLVDQLGIKTEIDLRYDASGITSPDASIRYVKCGIKQYDFVFPDMNSARPFQSKYAEGLKKAFLLFTDEANYPIVFHCAVGADRTGTFAFLLGGLLGLSYEDLVRDYELTSFYFGRRWRAKINVNDNVYSFDLSNEPDELESREFNRMYNHVLTTYGTADGKLYSAVENYLIGVVGLSKNDIETIRSILIQGYKASFELQEKVQIDRTKRENAVNLPALHGKTVLNVKIDDKTVDFAIYDNGNTEELTILNLSDIETGLFRFEIECEDCVFVGVCRVFGNASGDIVEPISNGGQYEFETP